MTEEYQYGDYNRGGMWAFSFSMVVTLAFFVYVAFVHKGVDLKELQQSQPKTESPAAAPAPADSANQPLQPAPETPENK